jgi:predicted transcriptional regulator
MMRGRRPGGGALRVHAIAKPGDVRYVSVMTKLLEQALATTDQLSPEMQDDLARLIMAFTSRKAEVYELSGEELADLEEALAEADRGEYATDEEVAALWTKHQS